MVRKKRTKNNKVTVPGGLNLITRAVIGAVLFIVGFNFSYSSFFKENPLYGVNFLAETLISITMALFGFYIIPVLYQRLKTWVEMLILNAVSEIVGNFWEQQTRRINNKKRAKRKKTARENKRKLQVQLENSIVVDTSVLVDGRILDIVKTGFLDNTLVIPSAVANELHLISDSDNKQKRERGRRGLDIIKQLKNKTKVFSPSIKTKKNGVDSIILEFAKNNKLKLMTQVFNVNKLASASGVNVLNVNELVDAVKVSVIPGEKLSVEITHPGKEKNQGVGYMPDGTMLVVENAKDLVGKEVECKVNRVIQSPAGKIIFCKLIKK